MRFFTNIHSKPVLCKQDIHAMKHLKRIGRRNDMTTTISFEHGQLYMTRGVSDYIADNSGAAKYVWGSLLRHQIGDWGDVGKEDWEANMAALVEDLRLFSVYKDEDRRTIWIITEADRRSTTILFPEEY